MFQRGDKDVNAPAFALVVNLSSEIHTGIS